MAKYNELLHIDFDKWQQMTVPEMRKAVSQLRKTVNARAGRLEKAGLKTPALQALKKSGGSISTRTKKGASPQKQLSQLRKEFYRAKSFLESETSTVKGFKNVRKRTVEALGLNKKITPKQYDKLWKVYEKLKEQNPEVESRNYRYHILSSLSDEIVDNPRLSIKSLVSKMGDMIRSGEAYEEMIDEDGDDYEGFSRFFENE